MLRHRDRIPGLLRKERIEVEFVGVSGPRRLDSKPEPFFASAESGRRRCPARRGPKSHG